MHKLTSAVLFLATLGFFQITMAASSCQIMVHNSQASAYSPEVTVVIGTDRQGAVSANIASEIISQLSLQPGVKINLINLAKLPKSIFKSDYFDKKSAAFEADFVAPISRANGVIFVVPEYDGAVPCILSYYLNHMRSSFNKKQVALVGISAGKWGARSALDGFKRTLTHRGARILGDLQINIEKVGDKIENGHLSDADSKNRLSAAVNELVKTLQQEPGGLASQKSVAKLAEALKDKPLELNLNNSNSVQGKLSNVILNENGTLAYVQFAGPTKIKNHGKIIPGQDVDVHSQGYGMPVGAVKKFKSEWYKKGNLSSANLILGKRIKLEYESGILVNGQIKNLTLDADGNLLVITFADVVVKNGSVVLFEKSWGDFDIAVADFVVQISP